MKEIQGIYQIRNLQNGKVYIGSSKNIFTRWKRHLSNLKNKNHPNSHLQSSFNKYGINNFSFEILEETNELIKREQFYIDNEVKNLLYNKSFIAGSGGGDSTSTPVYILNLEGYIIKQCNSGVEAATFLKLKLLDYKHINTPRISRKKYRVVTPDFYFNYKKIIKEWPNYSNFTEFKKQESKTPKYITTKDSKKILHFSQKTIAKLLDTSHQRVAQIIKLLETQEVKKYFHKKTRISIEMSK